MHNVNHVHKNKFNKHKHFTCRSHRHLGNQMYKKLTYLYTYY
jgi:hypothetical protein